MLEEFSFGNYCSFKAINTLSLSAAKIRSKNPKIDDSNVISIDNDFGLLKTKAIYGANASGKSNIVQALVAFIKLITTSAKDEQAIRLIDSFQLSTETEREPSFFQIIFRIDNIRYRYGFEADFKSIKSEWLFSTPAKREQNLFIREGKNLININPKHFEEGLKYQSLFEHSDDAIFTDTSLFISHLALTGIGKVSKQVVKAISSMTIISGLGHRGMYESARECLTDEVMKPFILNFLRKADVGINDMYPLEITNDSGLENLDDDLQHEIKKAKITLSTRTKYDSTLKPVGESNFSFINQESEGTKKMFELSPHIFKSFKEGSVLIIDEFDSRFHSLLTKKIVEIYNSTKNKSAQLIFITHDTNLLSLDLLRRDQIDFVEKDKYGASHLYTLVEIKGVRNDASFEKDYIQGKYGAIPFLGDFTNLINLEDA